MKKVLLVLALVALAVPAFAEPIVPNNSRTVTVSVGSEPALQGLVDSIFGCAGCVNVQDDQQMAAMWGIISQGAIVPIIRFEYAGYAPQNTFGLWSGTDTEGPISSVQIFAGAAVSDDSVTVKWNGASSGTVYNSGGTIATFTNIPWWSFGFYLTSPEGTFYSADQLNGGLAQMVAYREPESNTWALGWEDKPVSGMDRDYNDFVVSIESIVPVPEPASMLLLGTGLLGLVAGVRRRARQ